MTSSDLTEAGAFLDDARAWIAAGAESAVADLGRMIAIDTSFPPGLGYDDFAGLMEGFVAPLGFASERVAVPEALWPRR